MPGLKSRNAPMGGYHSNMKERAYAPLNATGGHGVAVLNMSSEVKSATLRLPKTKFVSHGQTRINDIMEASQRDKSSALKAVARHTQKLLQHNSISRSSN